MAVTCTECHAQEAVTLTGTGRPVCQSCGDLLSGATRPMHQVPPSPDVVSPGEVAPIRPGSLPAAPRDGAGRSGAAEGALVPIPIVDVEPVEPIDIPLDRDTFDTSHLSEEALIATVRQEVQRDMQAGAGRSWSTGRPAKFLIGALVVFVALAIVPLFFSKGIVASHTSQPTTPTSAAESDLTQFSQSQRGEAADAAAVARVNATAVRTPIPTGGTMWALHSGTTCFGVEVTPGVVGVPTPVASSYCNGPVGS